MTYKPHIDGLRALAVLAVVFFHFKVGALSGGFVGVDVFFVISGYLITSIIVSELERDAFTFRGFYARRARRILPASLAVVAAVALFGWFAVLPTDLVVLGKSIVATVGFVSNFFFLGQSGYFGADTQTLHLLHTWSLAVEEQFYFLLPFFLFSLRNSGKTRLFQIVATVASASLALSVLGTRREPAVAFYLLPFRAWELLVGALVAIRPPSLATSPRLASGLTLAGFVLFGLSVVIYGPDTPFPGIAAAAPTLGAALLIAAGAHAARWLRWPLTNSVMTFVGKISYSMYLWHWPMAVAYRTTFDGDPALTPLLFVPLLPISYVSYRFVEQPFRNPGFWAPKSKIALAFAISLLLGGFGVFFVRTHGMLFRLNAVMTTIAEASDRRQRAATNGDVCFSAVPWEKFAAAECLSAKPGRRTVFLWGDSVAAHYSVGLRAAARGTDIDLLEATMVGCSPSLGWNPKNRPLCKGRNDAVLAHVTEHPPTLVLLAGEWPWEEHPDGFKPYLTKTLAALQDAGLRVILLGPPIEYTRPLPELLMRHIVEGKVLRTPPFVNALSKKIDTDLKKGAIELHGAKLVSLFDLMCTNWECPTLTPEQLPLEWDTRHLTREGSMMVGKKLFAVIEAELGKATKPTEP